MRKYSDYIPANAEILISYKPKESVKFSYPIKWTYNKAVWKRGFLTVLVFWISLNTFIILYPFIYILAPYFLIKTIFFPSYEVINYISKNDYTALIPVLILLSYSIVIPAVFTFICSKNKKMFSKLIPKIGYLSAKLNLSTIEKKFSSKDMHNNKIIILSFSNIYLYYTADKDFSKYLKKVEILAHNYVYKRRNLFFPFIKKEYKNDFNFIAIFHFTKKPNSGSLKVEYS